MTAPIAPSASVSPDLITLSTWMAGDFSNFKQADAALTDFAHIRIFFRPLPYEFFEGLGLPGGIGFYSEQVYDYDLWSPYRQGLHRVIDKDGQIYIENYGFKDGVPYAGSGHNADILKTIPAEGAIRRQGCSMVFQREGDLFIGGVEPGHNCRIPRQGKWTYLVSRVELSDRTWVSLDQGMDIETDEHVWGSTEGALRFEKRESFAHELPLGRL
ncbi:chromophore lyase CpcT/CpeT [cf. Phormidesmis sp. LEGE 11477]|uniref:chromophore lyase CpcT/CpeT n=1 Tax=cf. Phormidesmis sp. LEGE 11477 TaxID=1828680 RepID=UPI00187ECEA0|nr:chromophore lyase CpcT/CpeT [cf. Phormidesmis sp. LEGE 11477]MBE9060208.1 chromophore lyase CpcT/CpeT [cf. Phormidesmis sp. LEGE 11477]